MTDMQQAMTHLGKADKIMRKIIRQVGPLETRKSRSGFPVLAQSIVSQQLSVKAAATILGRILAHAPGGKLHPDGVIEIGHARLVSCGLSRPKAHYLIGLA